MIDLPNGDSFLVAVLATWWTGRTPLVVPPGSTPQETKALFAATGGVPPTPPISALPLQTAGVARSRDDGTSRTPRPEPHHAWSLPSGGSTGLPGLVPVAGPPAAVLAGQQRLLSVVGWRPAAVQLVLGPLFHAAPFTSALSGLAAGNHLVVPDRFTPAGVAEVLTVAPPTWCQLTPHHMAMIGCDEGLADRLCGTLEGLLHTAAPCPEDVKRAWIERLGGERLFEIYGSTQMLGTTVCDGVEWLERPGTVGRPFMTRIRILDEDGRRLPAGTVGEVAMRSPRTRQLTAPEAAQVRPHPGGFYGAGDLGHLDEAGYLFLSDRVDDVIIVGGANVSAREIENVLTAHPLIREAVVSGRPHPVLGELPHAVVVCEPGGSLTLRELKGYCAQYLASHKVPASFEAVGELARSRAGKVQRYRYHG
ncbi:class I adenylate-forming enzyme family protein [Streptomyces ossamyceticus]|uniref:class I adenylate-forming enzyme family protein n=1 Tax=Streptomyces ossamyceticus TaxID=249581 RepID=UPI0006E2F6F4|nr:AMP-binding protein [Streptomyces ossamyceticus]